MTIRGRKRLDELERRAGATRCPSCGYLIAPGDGNDPNAELLKYATDEELSSLQTIMQSLHDRQKRGERPQS